MFRQKLQSFHVLTKALDVILVLLTPSFTLFSSCESFQGRCNCGEDLKNDGGGDVRTDALVTAPRSPHPVAMKDTEIQINTPMWHPLWHPIITTDQKTLWQ